MLYYAFACFINIEFFGMQEPQLIRLIEPTLPRHSPRYDSDLFPLNILVQLFQLFVLKILVRVPRFEYPPEHVLPCILFDHITWVTLIILVGKNRKASVGIYCQSLTRLME